MVINSRAPGRKGERKKIDRIAKWQQVKGGQRPNGARNSEETQVTCPFLLENRKNEYINVFTRAYMCVLYVCKYINVTCYNCPMYIQRTAVLGHVA